MWKKFCKAWAWFENIPTIDWILQVLGVRNMISCFVVSVLLRFSAYLKSWPWWLSEIFTILISVFILFLLLIFIGYITEKKKDKDAQLEKQTIIAKDKYLSLTGKKLVSLFIFVILIGTILMFAYALYLYKVPPKEKPIQKKQIEQKKVLLPPVVKEMPNVKEIPVYKHFMSAHRIHETKLGKPIEKAKLKDVYEAAHEHAIIIFPNSLSKYYRLRTDDYSFSEYPQSILNLDRKWIENEWLKKRFPLATEGLKPPYSQVAVSWAADEKNWSWIGYRLWHCFFDNIHYQKFEHGVIIGSFPKKDTIKNKDFDVLYILFDDFRYDVEESETLHSSGCIHPIDNDNELPSVYDYQANPASTIGK